MAILRADFYALLQSGRLCYNWKKEVFLKAVYINSGIPEKVAKKKFGFPENIMMENAAAALENAVFAKNPENVAVLCGSGNNGGDGYALSRRLFGKVKNIFVAAFGEPKTEEAALQRKMCLSVGVKIFTEAELDEFFARILKFSAGDVIVDCVYGTGFHGELPQNVKAALELCNGLKAFRIACDVPSGMKFAADKTVTMGALKKILYEDRSKDFVGEIVTAGLGISSEVFESCAAPDAYIIEENDVKLPLRTKKSVHKGDFGHVCVVLGEKAGAGIIAGTAALRFGAGFSTLLQNDFSARNFAMSPELMVSENFPEKTTAVLLGSGLGRSEGAENLIQKTLDFVFQMKNPAVVLEADFFYSGNLMSRLEKLNSCRGARVILTPHPKELCALVNALSLEIENLLPEKNGESGVKYSLSDVVNFRFEFGKAFSVKFPNIALAAKGANTYIFCGKETFICDKGTNSLAKAGSGDVLAGMCASLLAQGYSAREAALSAVYFHAEAGTKFQFNFECSPLKLIEKLTGGTSSDENISIVHN